MNPTLIHTLEQQQTDTRGKGSYSIQFLLVLGVELVANKMHSMDTNNRK